jgi:tripartite-type tricarboxylate transporter receptor subunit TctC
MKISNKLFRFAIIFIASYAMISVLSAENTTKNPSVWPTKPLKIMVGFPAGTSPDLVARTLAEPLSKALGQPVIVENKPGAGGNIAADIVAKASDQHTIGVMINGNLTIAKLLNPKTPFDPAKDLAPLSLIGTAPLVLAAPANTPNTAPGSSVGEFLTAARLAGNTWSYGSPGVGTVGHIGMELLKSRTGISAMHVPYPGYPQVVTAMLGGQIQLSMLPPGLAMTQARAGKVSVIGVTSSGRSTLMPEVPSLSEAGVRDFQLEIWNGVAGPATLPRAVVDRLSTLISEIARTPEVRQKLFQQGWQVAGTSAEGLAKRMQADYGVLGRVIAQQGIKAE